MDKHSFQQQINSVTDNDHLCCGLISLLNLYLILAIYQLKPIMIVEPPTQPTPSHPNLPPIPPTLSVSYTDVRKVWHEYQPSVI